MESFPRLALPRFWVYHHMLKQERNYIISIARIYLHIYHLSRLLYWLGCSILFTHFPFLGEGVGVGEVPLGEDWAVTC